MIITIAFVFFPNVLTNFSNSFVAVLSVAFFHLSYRALSFMRSQSFSHWACFSLGYFSCIVSPCLHILYQCSKFATNKIYGCAFAFTFQSIRTCFRREATLRRRGACASPTRAGHGVVAEESAAQDSSDRWSRAAWPSWASGGQAARVCGVALLSV